MAGQVVFSIITVVFNARESILETLDSVREQSYESFEYIVIDGSSTDGTLAILKDNGDIFDTFISEPDQGIYDAMNKGLAIAQGQWVNFMNAGDTFYDDSVLENVSQLLSGDVVYGAHAVKGGSNKIVHPKKNNYFWDERNIPYCHQSAFIRREVLEKNKFDCSYRLAADYDQYLRIKMSGAVIKPIPLVVSSYLPGGVSQSNDVAIAQEYFSIMRRYWPVAATIAYLYRIFKSNFVGKVSSK
ncbi:glycosyltransferase [Marinobacter nauticus]